MPSGEEAFRQIDYVATDTSRSRFYQLQKFHLNIRCGNMLV